MSDPHPFDGAYKISTTSTALGFANFQSDGDTRIEKSETDRVDNAGCKWNSRFELVSQGVVKMTSIADPSNADEDFFLTVPNSNGKQTREPQTYETLLDVTYVDGKAEIMSGQIDANGIVVHITMTRVGD
ncbi:MAG: hypothetical protein AAF182_00715 [Pseudomonadota bacterium]